MLVESRVINYNKCKQTNSVANKKRLMSNSAVKLKPSVTIQSNVTVIKVSVQMYCETVQSRMNITVYVLYISIHGQLASLLP